MAYTVGQTEVDVFPNAKGWDSALAAQIDPQVEAIGKRIADKLANDVRDGIRRGLLEAKATGAPTVNLDVDTAGATADLLAFRAEADAISKDTGDSSGNLLAQGMRTSFIRNSPLIAAGIAGGLALGAPAVLGAAGLLFAGVAAAAVHSNAQVQAAFTATKTAITSTFTDAAAVTVPFFVSAMNRIGSAVTALGPQFHAAFASLGAPIDSLTTGLIALARNAMPGIVAAVQSASPVFQGLSSALAAIGTGIGQFFQLISQHSSAAGTAFAAFGQIVGEILPILGELIGQGAELASQILPPLAAVLGVVAHALEAVGPILPVVVAGFLGLKAVTALTGPLELLSAKLQTVAADGGKLTTALAGNGASAVSKMGTALPVLGAAVAVVGGAFEAQSQQVHKWAQAMLDGGNAASQAQVQIQKLTAVANLLSSGGSGLIANLTGYGTALNVTAQSGSKAAATAKELYDAMSPLQQRQQDVTKATNDYSSAVGRYGANSLQANEAAGRLASANQALASAQGLVNTAMEGSQTSAQRTAAQLQIIADRAGAANTQISLLKGALDALTGANMTADQAEIAITQAVQAATTATQGQTGALIDASGQLDLHSAKGAAAAAALMNLASTQHNEIAVLEQQGASTDAVSAKSDALRGQFIQVAQQMGFTAGQAQNLANRYFGIPGQVSTTINAYDNASAVISRVQSLIAGLHNKDIFITTYNRVVSSGAAGLGGAALPQAQGGIVKMFADGGFNPMAANIAQVVPPGTKRIIGDNPNSDEAYIPINNSARSLAILGETAARMGLGLTSGANSGSGPAQFTGNLYLDSGEFLGKVYGVAAQATADYADAASTRSRFNR